MPTAARLTAAIDVAAERDGIRLDHSQRDLRDRLAGLGANRSRVAGKPRGLYIHGPVGRGKSWLADAFFSALPARGKTRVHFHGFFDELHRSIYRHRSGGDANGGDAIERAIDEIAGERGVLFFDELHVHDSGDARLLTRLLEQVFQRDVTVLATSNYAPEDLLPNPIWHHIFEPGIRLITANMDTYRLDGAVDYRTRRRDHSTGFAAGSWSAQPSAPADGPHTALSVRGRQFSVISADSGLLWVSFEQLCESPTSTIEYRAWVREFPRWVITDIPAFDETDAQAQQRFINVVDVLVDADIPVDFVSRHPLETFLAAASTRPDASRMVSRLQLLR